MTLEQTGIDSTTLRRRLSRDEQKNSHKRRFERHATFIVTHLVIMNTSQHIAGVVDEISLGGMRFRPASKYLQRRDTETVSVSIDGRSFSGRIRASRPDGYGIELLDNMSDHTLEDILALGA